MEEVRADELDAYTAGVSVTRYDPSNGMVQLRESVQSISESPIPTLPIDGWTRGTIRGSMLMTLWAIMLIPRRSMPPATRGKVHEFLGMKSTRGKADLFTKTLEGPAFEKFKALIMGG
jgi:hypothetical protein